MNTALTMYNIEEHLVALLDTADMVETPEQQEAIFGEIQQALVQAVEKRDRVSQFLVHCESQAATIDAEIRRLQGLKRGYVAAADRMESYIVRTIMAAGTDEKGKYRKLEGRTCAFSLRACPASVEIKSEESVPAEYKALTVTLPASVWEELLGGLDIDERAAFLARVKATACAIDKRAVKEAIDDGLRKVAAEAQQGGVTAPDEIQAVVDAAKWTVVPGAVLVAGKYNLKRQ